jgi:hypothetical protein
MTKNKYNTKDKKANILYFYSGRQDKRDIKKVLFSICSEGVE